MKNNSTLLEYTVHVHIRACAPAHGHVHRYGDITPANNPCVVPAAEGFLDQLFNAAAFEVIIVIITTTTTMAKTTTAVAAAATPTPTTVDQLFNAAAFEL